MTGGFDLGLEQTGIKTLWQVETDARCNEVLAHHWPDVQRFGDIKNVGKHNLEPVDIISGGVPCVGFSVAGRRAGLADERSRLWWEMLRVIEELRPTWVVIENVPGLRSSWSRAEPPPHEAQVRDFDQESDAEEWARRMACDWEVEETSDLETILASLGQLGYWWAYRSLDAQFYNLAQRRERVFIVGCSGDVGGLGGAQSGQDVSGLAELPAKVLFEPESLSRDTAPGRGERKDVAAPLKASSPSRRAGGSWPIAEEFVVTGADGYALADFGAYRQQPGTLRASGGDTGGGSEVLVVQDDDVVKHALSGHNQRNDPDGEHFVVAYTVQTNDGGEHRRKDRPHGGMYVKETDTSLALGSSDQAVVAFDWQSGGDVRLNISGEHTSAMQASQTPAVLTCMGVRRLTVTECELLQGFPRRWTGVNGASDTARYRQLGNAVAVPLARWIGRRIAACHKESMLRGAEET